MQIAVLYCQNQSQRVGAMLQGLKGAGVQVRRVALPCSGKMEVLHLTRALESGAEGVALCGCPEEECGYLVGSRRAKGRVRHAQRILSEIGLEEVRVRRFVLPREVPQEGAQEFFSWVEELRGLKRIS